MEIYSKKDIRTGVVILIAAFFIGSIQNALIKSIRDHYPAITIVFIQYCLCLFFLFPTLCRNGFAIMKTNHLGLLIFRSLTGLGYFYGVFYALKTVPLVDVTLLSNTGPLWVPLICFFWDGIPISFKLYVGILTGLIGIILVLMPHGWVFSMGSSGILFALGAGICLGIAMVSTRHLTQTETFSRILIYYFLIAAFITMPFAIVAWQAPTLYETLILITNAILMLIQQRLINYGFSKGPSTQLSITTYSSVVFSVFLGWIFWDESITAITIMGIILIFLGSYQVVTTDNPKQIVRDEKNDLIFLSKKMI